ncbi:uncharacterized protein LOC126415345 isoform X3 [Schistocerca serialis cubense]|uniref:uncharacterized protein LOC126415345 isoform X3 n=1 Tax=Schistocerca serialis cubense TaxID=2023355 RepID=UPI00214EC7CD|nr:uncharacterized protein LOC126415345 isoform X3 [Schistocerca serialis cubense]
MQCPRRRRGVLYGSKILHPRTFQQLWKLHERNRLLYSDFQLMGTGQLHCIKLFHKKTGNLQNMQLFASNILETVISIITSEKIQLRHRQQLPEPVDEMTADVMHYASDSKDPFNLSHMALSMPVNIHYGSTAGAKQEDSDNSASSDDPFRDSFSKLQDLEYFDTDSSSWDQSAASFMSWSDQEFESATTERIQKLMDDIECILYDEPLEMPPSKEIIDECRMWKEAFPHMRVRGHGIKMIAVPQEEESHESIIQEEVFAVDGVVNDAKESSSLKRRESSTDNSSAHCKEVPITEESKSCQLENMVENYVLQQLASYIQSEVIKKLTCDVQSSECSSGKKCDKLPDVCFQNSTSPQTVVSVLSDSESDDTNSARTVLSKSSRTREVLISSSSRSELRVQNNNAFSTPRMFDVGNYTAEYPSFSVIGSAPVSLPPPRTASSSVHEARSFHSAAERNKRQYADRRFSCGFTARERSSHQVQEADEKNQKYKALLYNSNNRKQFLPPNPQDKLNKRLVLPPIDKVETQKMSASHGPNKTLSVHGFGFSRSEFIKPSVAQHPGMSKFGRRKNEQQLKKV